MTLAGQVTLHLRVPNNKQNLQPVADSDVTTNKPYEIIHSIPQTDLPEKAKKL